MEALRVAIASPGNIARVHAKALSEAPGPAVNLVAVMDVDDGKLGPFGRGFGIRETYRNLNDLLSHGRPDLVHVCTPPSTHCELVLCSSKGVHKASAVVAVLGLGPSPDPGPGAGVVRSQHT